MKYPVFDSKEINADTFKSNFESYGSILVRNLLDRNILNSLYRSAQEAYLAADNQIANGELTDAHSKVQLEKFGHINASKLGVTDNPNMPSMLGMFCNSRIPALYKNLLGENINILSGIALPRRQTPGTGNPPVPFHQDAGFMGNPGLVIN